MVRRREPMGSPQTSSSLRKPETPLSSPRTTAIASPRNASTRYRNSINDDPNVSALAMAPPQAPPASNSFLEQLNVRTPDVEMPPEDGALQFIPAFGGGLPGSSWSDDDEDKNEQNMMLLTNEDEKKDDRSSVTGATSSSFAQRARRWKRAQTERHNKVKSTVDTTQPTNNRIARLTSMFSSRVVVKGNGSAAPAPVAFHTPPSKTTTSQSAATPGNRHTPSPAPSSSSSGYVGWPGTQDKGGHTVSLPSSYDDSSSGAPGRRGSNNHVTPSPNEFSRRNLSAMQYAQKQPEETTEPNFWQQFPEWDGEVAPSSPSTVSKTSSAYFQHNELRQLEYPDLGEPKQPYGVAKTLTASIVRQRSEQETTPKMSPRNTYTAPAPPSASPRNFHAPMASTRTSYNSRTSPVVSPRTSHTARGTPISSPQEVYTPRGTTPAAGSPRAAWTPKVANYSTRPVSPGRNGPTTAASPPGPQTLTKEHLAVRDHLTPPHRPFGAAKGYSGLLEKTKEVPSLMDDMNDSETSSRATSAHTQSDVFDGISSSDVFDNLPSPKKTPVNLPERINEEEEEEDFKVVSLGGGLTVIQSSVFGYSNRVTASDYDDNLTNSDVDNQGYARTPDIKRMLTAGTSGDSALTGIHGNIGNRPRRIAVQQEDIESDGSGSSIFTDPYINSVMDLDGDLAEYYIDPLQMKKVLRKFRQLTERCNAGMSLTELERAEDESKAFALFEMRSRIMEKDIERGLERRGGTVVVDDLVTTPYFQESHRIRDAVIVSKAWRDGTSPSDVINTSILTRRLERSYFIKRMVASGPANRFSGYSSVKYYWEAVRWVDDTQFSLYRCPSLGPRNLRGFEMFTVGDCQSILLKLTNERCQELRRELNDATKDQIEAEEVMRAEGDDGDGMMTEAEMAYLTAMEKVKSISKKLVAAEQSFALVRDRIEKLVERYQSLLLKIETESFTGASSIVTYGSSHYSDRDSAFWNEEEAREAALWARRARRAEIKAEVAAREALLARQEARMVREEKERELDSLRQKLMELQSETSQVVSERMLASRLASRPQTPTQTSKDSIPMPGASLEKQKLDGVKQRFRERMAARKRMAEPEHSGTAEKVHFQEEPTRPKHRNSYQASLMRSAGEEMYQQLDFYERSLKSIDRNYQTTNNA